MVESYGRVYNGIDHKAIEWRIWGYRIGVPTAVVAISMGCVLYLLSGLGIWVSLAWLGLTVVVTGWLAVFFSRVDPYKRLSETAVVRMVVHTLIYRDHDTLPD